jgi:hypothetical protein
MAPAYDVTSTLVQTIETDRDQAYEVLARIDPMRSFANRLAALGVDDRALWCESNGTLGLLGSDGRRELRFRLTWRFDDQGRHATVDWRISVDEDAWGGTVLTTRLAARSSDVEARERVLATWLLVEELARGHARRLARAVEDHAEESVVEVPRLRAVV